MLGKCVLVWHICTTTTSSTGPAGFFLGMREGGVVGVWCVSLKWVGPTKKQCAEARVVGGVCGPLHHS